MRSDRTLEEAVHELCARRGTSKERLAVNLLDTAIDYLNLVMNRPNESRERVERARRSIREQAAGRSGRVEPNDGDEQAPRIGDFAVATSDRNPTTLTKLVENVERYMTLGNEANQTVHRAFQNDRRFRRHPFGIYTRLDYENRNGGTTDPRKGTEGPRRGQG